ncbi:MAG: STAS domain-containing protein [Planctomycetes bacterium]|nr:STAS domain-containing protein [Planctomycetota bacterium]
MQTDVEREWRTEIERGPGWLFVKLRSPAADVAHCGQIADNLFQMMQSHLTRRMVLDLEDVPVFKSELLSQMLRLNNLVQSQGGILRLTGLSENNREVLRRSRLGERLAEYESREAAVLSAHRQLPR